MEVALAKQAADGFDWAELRREFQAIKECCVPFQILTVDDLERCKLSDQTYGLIPSNHVERVRSWDCVSVHDRDKQEQLVDMCYVHGFSDDTSCSSAEHQENRPDLWRSIETAIARRRFSNQLMQDLGKLNFYWAYYSGLYLFCRNEYDRSFYQVMIANSDATDIQRHWYAHWVCRAKRVDQIDRDEAQTKLIALIDEIRVGHRQPWAPYPTDWFVSMLATEKDPFSKKVVFDGDLKTSYIKLTNKELQRMTEHPLITPRVLPPLSVEKFRRL